jgi:hypothetical protein
MSKYNVLAGFLKSQLTGRVAVTFGEVEEALGFALPASAYAYPAWWSNDPTGHSQARAWLDAGFATERVDVAQRRLVFRRLGAAEDGRLLKHAAPAFRHVERHPAAGVMAGTFTLEATHDSSTRDDDLARKIRLIAQGLQR